MSRQVAIYSLLDPDTIEIRYVGKSIDPKERLKHHMSRAGLQVHCRATNWKKSILNRGLIPLLGILEMVPEEIWQEREQFWIQKLLDEGCDLTNTTKGGEGRKMLPGVPAYRWTEEHKKNSKAARVGLIPKKPSPEMRAKQGASLKASWVAKRLLDPSAGNKWGHHTEEAKKRIGSRLRGKKMIGKQLEAIRVAALSKRGKLLSEHHKQRLREGWIERKRRAAEQGVCPSFCILTIEQRQKISDRFKGKSLSLEHRQKLSEGQKRRKKVTRSQKHKDALKAAWVLRKARTGGASV